MIVSSSEINIWSLSGVSALISIPGGGVKSKTSMSSDSPNR